MTTLLKVIHGLFIAGLIVQLTLGIGLGMPAAVAAHQVTNAATVTDWLARAEVHQTIVRAGFLSSLEQIHEQAETLPQLNNELLADRYMAGFPMEAAQQVIDATLVAFYDYLSIRSETVDLNFNANDFQTIATYIQTNGAQIITDYVQQLPTCPGQMDDLDRYLRGECVPQELPRAALIERFQGYWQVEHAHLSSGLFARSEFENYEALAIWRKFFVDARLFTEWWLGLLLLGCTLLVYVRSDRLRGLRDLRTCWIIGTIISILLLALCGGLLYLLMQNLELSESGLSSDLVIQAALERTMAIAFQMIAAQTVMAGLLGCGLSWTALRWSRKLS